MTTYNSNLAQIAEALGCPTRENNGWRCLCPVHADRNPSLSISLAENGRLLVKCWSGCDGRKVLQRINSITGGGISVQTENTQVRPRDQRDSVAEWAKRLWFSSIPILHGDLASRYLLNRGLELTQFPKALRFKEKCRVTGEKEHSHLPALIARFDDEKGHFSTVHRIYLQEPGIKAQIQKPKRIASSPSPGGAIRLFPAGKELGIAEGIETALACSLATGIPVWAAYSSSLMPQVKVPNEVTTVTIFSDKDRSGAGQEAAFRLRENLLKRGLQVKTLIPPGDYGRDWLDVFNE